MSDKPAYLRSALSVLSAFHALSAEDQEMFLLMLAGSGAAEALGYRILPEKKYLELQLAGELACKLSRVSIKEVKRLAGHEAKNRKCSDVRRQNSNKLKETIDKLVAEGYRKGEIYGKMRTDHGSLIRGRSVKNKDGTVTQNKYMTEKNMWKRYENEGGNPALLQ